MMKWYDYSYKSYFWRSLWKLIMENMHGWLFNLQPGMEILVLGDEKRGLAILPKEMQKEYISRIFSEMDS